LADKAISVMNIQTAEKQNILEEFDTKEKVQKALVIINKEVQRLELGDKIQSDVQDEISNIRVNNDDVREYSFTDLARAEYMRRIMIGHLEEKIKKETKVVSDIK
jgi:ATP-dependent Lon protease